MKLFQTLVKYVCFLYYKKDIIKLLDNLKKFWDHARCGKKLYAGITNVHQYIGKVQKIILVITGCMNTTFLLRPVIGDKQRFIFYCWVPYGSLIWETICLFAQYYFTLLIVPVVFACDAIYFSFSIHVISQMRLLNWELENMSIGDGDAKIKDCIRHHQLILE